MNVSDGNCLCVATGPKIDLYNPVLDRLWYWMTYHQHARPLSEIEIKGSTMIKGACHCGSVHLSISGTVTNFEHCHCNTCRKFHGSVYGSSALVDASGFAVTAGEDALQGYRSSPGKERFFCRQCGCHLFAKEDDSDKVLLRIGTLEGTHGLMPEGHIYVCDRVPWSNVRDGLPQHAANSNETAG